MIIALVGGTAKSRAAVTSAMKAWRPAAYLQRLSALDRRGAEISRAISLSAERRVFTPIVIDHLLSAEEAAQVRAAGGFVWHISSLPSASVPFVCGRDYLIDAGNDEREHVFSLGQALRACKRCLQL